MQAKTYSSIGAALAGDLSAVREYEAAEKAVNEFGAKMARMIGKDRLEKISWLTQKACSPMIEKYLPGPH
jgi:hypothetical protein